MKKLLVTSLAAAVVLAGCNFGEMTPEEEKEAYINAVSDSACVTTAVDNGTISREEGEEQVQDIFDEYGFDSDDSAAMTELAMRYSSDPDLDVAISEALQGCAQ